MAGDRKAIANEVFGILGDVAFLPQDRVKVSALNRKSYISTENMRPNRTGVDWASTLPSGKQVTKFKVGEVLFSNIRTYFRKVWRATFEGGSSPDVLVFRTKDPQLLDGNFLFYVLSSESFAEYSDKTSKGAKMPRGDKEAIFRYKFTLPPLAEQRGIAHVLGTLDDLIELNRETNEILEEMARALFKSWFVDFDPVRRNKDEGGRMKDENSASSSFIPHPSAFDHLFPDHFQDSALGQIPNGWEVGRLDDVLILQRGFDLPTPDRTHGRYPVMAASGPNGCHDKFMVRGPGVTTGRSGVLGRVFFIHGDFWPLNTSLWVKEFKRVSPAYAFHLLRGLDFEIFNAGSAVPTLNRNHVHNLKVTIPPKTIVEAFDALVMPLMKFQECNEAESRDLATLRDTLLPKLLSGEISAPAAEALLTASR